MAKVSEFNNYGKEIETFMRLRTSPIAVKMLKTESDIPEGAMRPKRDRGYHLAQCQAFSMSRRQGTTIAIVSHSMATIADFCHRALWLDHGQVQAMGDVDKVVAQYTQ